MGRTSPRALLSVLLAVLVAAAPAAAESGEPGKPTFDVRDRGPARAAVPADPAASRARDRLGAALGTHGVLDIDGRTGTPRMIARTDGFLTGPSGGDAADVALGYVRARQDAFGLAEADLATLRLVRRYTDVHGVTHLHWAQTWRGIPAWDHGLAASVDGQGRLVNVGGSPLPDLEARTAAIDLTASEALSEALGDAGRRGLSPRATPRGGPQRRTEFSGGHSAELVLFAEGRGDARVAWRVIDRAAPDAVYEHLIDARSGDVLYRENKVHGIDGQVRAFESRPGRGSETTLRAVTVDGPARLAGPGQHVFTDVENDGAREEVAANAPGPPAAWTNSFADKCDGRFCAWTPGDPYSWQDNRAHTAQQVYYFLGAFRGWLASEVGFTDATGGYGPGDEIEADAMLGADTNAGLPAEGFLDNAFMLTMPDGYGAAMGMYLFESGRAGGDDASVVLHEYGHGLSNRLVTRADGFGALRTVQAGAMGEGWSDWYALDYLVQRGLEIDDPATPGQLAVGQYADDDATGVRLDAIDCPMGATVGTCLRSRDTYGDFGDGGSQVHRDGEIWAQTLWDLRNALDGPATRQIVTEAMRLSPDDPSFLDQRDAILQADQVLNSGANRNRIWTVFAARGMGYSARTVTSADRAPQESFDLPPEPSPASAAPPASPEPPPPPPPAPTASTSPPSPVAPDRTPPGARLALMSGQKLRPALTKGMRLTVSCNEPCSARLNARLDAKTAKKLRLLPRGSRAPSVVVATGSVRMGEGRRTATLKFTRTARTQLARQRRLKLTISGPVTDRAGNARTKATKVALTR